MGRANHIKPLKCKEGLAELESLVCELSKVSPDTKMVQNITSQYGIPFETDTFLQIDRVLAFLDHNRFKRLPNVED